MAKWCSLFFVCFLCVGCAEPTTGTISGTVTIDGDLPETGYIGFTAIDGKTGPAGTEITDGKYTVTLPLGDAKVAIRVPMVVGKQKLYDTADSPVQDITEERLPARYNDETELTYTIEPGEATKDFELTTKRKKKK